MKENDYDWIDWGWVVGGGISGSGLVIVVIFGVVWVG